MNRYLVKSGMHVKLDEWNSSDRSAFIVDKSESKKQINELNDRLEDLQELLYAEHKHKVLVVLQGMDTSGKDGTIRHVFDGVNPQGVRVASFKAPTRIELDHDYLWRIHKFAPKKGEIMIFNRSHYEDVLVVRVHSLVPESSWRKRFEHINNFEQMLVDEGATIIKFFLHIDKDEQKKRLQARLDDPNKNWKFNIKDLEDRKLWTQYQNAYNDVLSFTSKDWAPWYIVPSNQKWYRNLVVGNILVETLEKLGMQYPEADLDIGYIKIN
jgi:PPK2 family polyphosphate:nucleotide phosphotransferase